MSREPSEAGESNVFQLSAEEKERIHDASIHILENFGIQVGHPEARELLEERGAEVTDDGLVKFPEELVMESLESVPRSFTIHARNPENNIRIGEDSDETMYIPGYGHPNIKKYGGNRRSSTIGDYEELMKLNQMEDVVSCTGYNLCEPNDTPQEIKHLEMVKRNVLLTDIPVLGSAYGEERARDSIDIARAAMPNPAENKPFIMALFNNVAPRQWTKEMTGAMLEYARQGQAVLIGAFVVASASGPATIPGTAALANAEALAGITIAQSANAGVPTTYTAFAGPLDVRTGALTMGAPETSFFSAFCAAMGKYYGIPHRVPAGMTDAKTIDDQSGMETTLSLTNAFHADPDIIMHAFGVLDSWSMVSPEKVVLDAERIRYLERLERGYEITDETIALDVIEDVEPGGDFISNQHTLEYSATDYYFPEVYSKMTYQDWEDEGAKDAYELAHDRVTQLLDEYERPEIGEDPQAEIEDIVAERRDAYLES